MLEENPLGKVKKENKILDEDGETKPDFHRDTKLVRPLCHLSLHTNSLIHDAASGLKQHNSFNGPHRHSWATSQVKKKGGTHGSLLVMSLVILLSIPSASSPLANPPARTCLPSQCSAQWSGRENETVKSKLPTGPTRPSWIWPLPTSPTSNCIPHASASLTF